MKNLYLLENCPICNHTDFEPYLNVTDHTVSHGTFQIQKCKKCALLLTNPRPTEETIGSFYESSEYISHHDESKDLFSTIYNQVRNVAIKQKINLIEKQNQNSQKKIIDIGCGTGFFLEKCAENGWQTFGMEPDTDARNKANEKLKGKVVSSITNPALAEHKYDVITMWHALEHVYDLNETLTWIEKYLASNGTLIIAVPNPESYDAEVYKEKWAAYDVPRHLYHFTKDSMEKLLQKYHFQITDINAMLFDSYYVSMLSSQYMYGSKKMIQSVINGSISNLKGYCSNPKTINTSSLIYIAKKR